MKITRFFVVALALCSLSSCSLIGSALKLPMSVIQQAGRTAGALTNIGNLTGASLLTDAPAQPVFEQGEQDFTTQNDTKKSAE